MIIEFIVTSFFLLILLSQFAMFQSSLDQDSSQKSIYLQKILKSPSRIERILIPKARVDIK